MAKFKFKKDKNAQHFELSAVEDVKVNGVSVFDGEEASIKLKTINNQNITGNGNIEIDVEDVVKTTANQGLTTQQKINARNNIEALGNSNIKQGTGDSTADVISQKGVTDLLAQKQSRVPNGINPLIALDTGKIDLVYIPSTVLGGITNGGTFNGSGVITASSYAPELQGLVIDEIQFASYPSYYFICSAPYSFAGFEFAVGDWAISLGNGWAKLNATDAVTSVNNKMGQVVLDYDDVGATKKSWGIDNANKNLVTDAQGNVSTSDYALGQIIVDYYEELPTNVPVTAKASVINSSSYFDNFTIDEINDSLDNGTILNDFIINETITRPTEEGAFLNVSNDNESLDMNYSLTVGEDEATINVAYTNQFGDYYEYYYSFIQQAFVGYQGLYLNVGWNKLVYDEQTGDYSIIQVQYSDLPILNNIVFYGFEDNDTGFINLFGHSVYHLSGEYIYTEIQPSTTPKTYYWRYTPTNVQSDNNEDNPLSLAYIKNRAVLDTTSSTQLYPTSETIKGTINLHKISKTGLNTDLINFVGQREPNNKGEIFNTYSGLSKNTASGEASTAFGTNNTASGTYSFAFGNSCQASNIGTFAHGFYARALSDFSTAEGYSTTTLSSYAHAQNLGTIARYCQTAIGKYNVDDTSNSKAFIIGNGTDNNNRSNINTIDWNGNAWFKGDIRVGGTSWETGTPIGGGGSTAKKKTLTEASQNYSVANNVVTVTDSDVTASTTDVVLYPGDTATETWLENNLSSCIITQAAGSFSFTINSNLPSTFSMYYIIMEVE